MLALLKARVGLVGVTAYGVVFYRVRPFAEAEVLPIAEPRPRL